MRLNATFKNARSLEFGFGNARLLLVTRIADYTAPKARALQSGRRTVRRAVGGVVVGRPKSADRSGSRRSNKNCFVHHRAGSRPIDSSIFPSSYSIRDRSCRADHLGFARRGRWFARGASPQEV